uniref:Uncharacterized protein n=1 Tax=Rhizophora mucronata TaxID=61149 RepID=A0A2P2PZC7_RHIMU
MLQLHFRMQCLYDLTEKLAVKVMHGRNINESISAHFCSKN